MANQLSASVARLIAAAEAIAGDMPAVDRDGEQRMAVVHLRPQWNAFVRAVEEQRFAPAPKAPARRPGPARCPACAESGRTGTLRLVCNACGAWSSHG